MKRSFTYFYKRLFKVVLYVILFQASALFSQQDDLLSKAEELVYSNPNEAIKIAKHTLKTAQEAQTKIHSNLIIGKSYLAKGDYNTASLSIFSEEIQDENVSIPTKVEVCLLKAQLLRILYLDKQSTKYLSEAENLTTQITNDKEKKHFQFLVALESVNMKLNRRKNSEALHLIEALRSRFTDFLDENKTLQMKLLLAKEVAYSQLGEFNLATQSIDSAFALLEVNSINNLNQKGFIYNELGNLYLQKKEFVKSEETLFVALRYAEIIDNPVLKMQINRGLAISYLATNQKNKYKVYNEEFLLLSNNVELMEQESVNTVFNLIAKQNEDVVLAKKTENTRYQNLLLFGLLFILTVVAFVLLKNQTRKKRLKEIIKYLEVSRNQFNKTKPKKRKQTKRIVIPEETEKAILLKLKKFENSQKFLNKEMSLAVLAGQFETNTKYLSEIINKHYNDNFNTFINKLRLNYIINKLKNEPSYINYKISFLAEESGYSSHSSFATVFKSIIGMSPATFINLIKEERDEQKQQQQQDEN